MVLNNVVLINIVLRATRAAELWPYASIIDPLCEIFKVTSCGRECAFCYAPALDAIDAVTAEVNDAGAARRV